MNEILTLKTCNRCGNKYPATSEFWPVRKGMKDEVRGPCKECKKKYHAQYVLEHRESARQSSARYIATHREEVRRSGARWRAEHPEHDKQRKAQYHAEHREENNRYSVRYNAEHREELKLANARWHAEHREQEKRRKAQWIRTALGRAFRQAAYHRRMARKRSLPDTLNPDDIQRAIEYFGGLCAACGKQTNGLFVKPHLDHWIPLSSSACPGSVPDNSVPLCSECNLTKSDKDPLEWLTTRFGKRKASQILKRIETYFDLVRKESIP
jgi:5-methylcytosine-specific restriction endonuclease McrA